MSKHQDVSESTTGSPFGDFTKCLAWKLVANDNVDNWNLENLGRREYEIMLTLVMDGCKATS